VARLDWVLACDLAFFDRQDRLCMIGVSQRFPVPRLPVALNQLMLVAKLTDLATMDEVEITIDVRGPSGLWTTPSTSEGVLIEMAGEYVLVTLRGLPLIEEGLYRFDVRLRGQPSMSVTIPVLVAGSSMHAEVH
jgi:hypothetical protein